MSSIVNTTTANHDFDTHPFEAIELQKHVNGAVMQSTANNVVDIEAAGGGGVIIARLGNSEGVDHHCDGYAYPSISKFICGLLFGMFGFHCRNSGVPVDADERVTRGGDEGVRTGAIADDGAALGDQPIVTGTQAHGMEIAAGRVVNHNDQHASATDLPSGENAAAIELCHRPTTSSATPFVPAAAYHAGTDGEAESEAITDAHQTPITLKAMAVAWWKRITTSNNIPSLANSADAANNHNADIEALVQEENDGDSVHPASTTLTARVIASARQLTFGMVVKYVLLFGSCVGALYFGWYQKASFDLQYQEYLKRHAPGANLVANFGA